MRAFSHRSILLIVDLLAGAAPAERDDPLLREAFARLQASTAGEEAEQYDRLIWLAWNNGGSETAVGHVARGMAAMEAGDLPRAIGDFTAAIDADPGFAEAWNKRATAHFLAGAYDASIEDIAATLVREPRHYGALSGLGQILLHAGNAAGALRAFDAVLAINPHLDSIRQTVDGLRAKLAPPRDRPTLH